MKTKLIFCLALVLAGVLFINPTAVGGPPPQKTPDLPGVSKGKIETYWLAPYVQVSGGIGRETVTWFDEHGEIKRQVAAIGVQPGFVTLVGNHLRGINEDWQIALPPQERSHILDSITSTSDSRVLVCRYRIKPDNIAMDIYVHGKLATTVGPISQHQGSDAGLNEDGSTALSGVSNVWVTDANGAIRFHADCDQAFYSPIVAPDAAGVLLRHNTGGIDENTFVWFTGEGEKRSVDIGPNPNWLGWVPKTCQSLFSTSVGFEYRHRLIDWDTGKSLWDIRCPGNGPALAVGLTPKLIIFAVAELYQPGPWRGAAWPLANNGKEWIRTFHAVSVQDGSLVARWQAETPQRLCGEDRDHFLWLGNTFFYVTTAEFVELNLEDIISKKHGWH